MRRLILHIGLEKTGTTSFQAFCVDNRRALAARGALYPANADCFLRLNHAPLAASYFSAAQAETFLIAGRRAGRVGAISALRNEIEAADAGLTLISAEHFSSRFDAGRVAQLGADLAGFDVSIAVVVRHPLARARAAYATTVASGRAITLDAFVDELCQPTNPYLRCRDTLEVWTNVFGRERMIVISYREGADIVATLAARVLPDIAVSTGAYMRNVSPSGARTERRRRANAGEGLWARLLAPAPAAFSPDQVTRIVASTSADLAWLDAAHGITLSAI